MSFLPRSAALVAVGVPFALGVASVTFGGCSGSDDSSPSGSGTDSHDDASTPKGGGGSEGGMVTPGADGAAPVDCSAACDKRYPDAGVKIDALDSCWSASCNDPCVNGVEGDAGEADDDAGAACQTAVDTGGVSCNTCTIASCCTEWDTCANDPGCVALMACYQTCP